MNQDKTTWESINRFLLNCGGYHESKKFCIQVIEKLYQLIPYNQARAIFINENGQIYDAYLSGIDKWWWNAYVDYYSKLESGFYHPVSKTMRASSLKSIGLRDWSCCLKDEFLSDYIRPQGIRYSLGFNVSDLNNNVKCIFVLDRTDMAIFTKKEIDILTILRGHLNNLHSNMFVSYQNKLESSDAINEAIKLTPREIEIAGMLCDGVKPIRISDKLCLSISTVYWHIANIHTKLNVTSRQELIVKLVKLA